MTTISEEIRSVLFVVKKSFKDAKGTFGMIIMTSGLWFITSLALITIPGSLAGAHYTMNKLTNGEKIRLEDFLTGFRKYYLRSLALVLLNIVVLGILYIDFVIFINSPNFIIQLLSGLWLYGILYVLFMSNFYYPLMIAEDSGLRRIIKQSLTLTSEYLIFTMLLSIIIAIVGIISTLTGALLVLLFMGIVSLFQNNAFYVLKYKSSKQQ